MKHILHFALIAGLTFNSFAASNDSLSSIVMEMDYVQNATALTGEAKKNLQAKFETEVKVYLANKSDAQILTEVKDLVADMPAGSQKKNFETIIEENLTNPAAAMKEIVDSQAFGKLKAGESANWSVFDFVDPFSPTFLAVSGVVIIIAVLVFNRNASKSKKNQVAPETYSEPQSGTFVFTGSHSTQQEYHWEKDSNGVDQKKYEGCNYTRPGNIARERAEEEVLNKCLANPLMSPTLCHSTYISSSVSESGDNCSASATMSFRL